jgi:hypothetical protein
MNGWFERIWKEAMSSGHFTDCEKDKKVILGHYSCLGRDSNRTLSEHKPEALMHQWAQ